MQPPTNCPPTFPSYISAIFYLPISTPNIFVKPSLQTLLTFCSFIPQSFFTSLADHAVTSTVTTKNYSPISTIHPFQTLPKAQWSKESCDLLYFQKYWQGQQCSQSLILYCSDSKNSVLQLVASDEDACNHNAGKPSTLNSPRLHLPLETSCLISAILNSSSLSPAGWGKGM